MSDPGAPSNSLDYLSQDFASAQSAAIQRIRARYPGNWNDFYRGNFGTVLLDLLAWNTATGAYTQNFLAGENFISTMRLRESAVRFGNLTGYKLANPAPAIALCDADLVSPLSEAVTIAQGTPVKSNSPSQTFEVQSNYQIAAGQTSPQTLVATFDPSSTSPRAIATLLVYTPGSTTVSSLDTTVDLTVYIQAGQWLVASDGNSGQVYAIDTDASGNPNQLELTAPWPGAAGPLTTLAYERRVALVQGQTYSVTQTAPSQTTNYLLPLSASPVIDGTVSISVNGASWSEVQSLGLAAGLDTVFDTVTLPATGSTVVRFGDGIRGALLPAGASLSISYRVGGGLIGNVSTGAINSSIAVIGNSTNTQYQLALINHQPATGGADAEPLESARLTIPASTQTGNRAVTKSDYETLATLYSGPNGNVTFARASGRGGNTLVEGNLVLVYAWTNTTSGGLTAVSGPLKLSLQAYLESVAVGTDQVLLADGTTQPLPVAARILAQPGSNPGDVSSAVETSIDTYVDSLVPGSPASFSQLISTILATQGVASATLATPQTDVWPQNLDTVFIAPSAAIPYTISLESESDGSVTGQLGFAPGTAWALMGTYNGLPLAVGPDTEAGYARFSGLGLDPAQVSRINLGTGEVNMFVLGVLQTLNFYLTPAQVYTLERSTDIYVSYSNQDSLALRQSVRSSLRAWSLGLGVGSPLYANPPAISTPSTPVSAYDVVVALGLSNVTVAITAPTNTASRLDVGETELATLRQVYCNGLSL